MIAARQHAPWVGHALPYARAVTAIAPEYLEQRARRRVDEWLDQEAQEFMESAAALSRVIARIAARCPDFERYEIAACVHYWLEVGYWGGPGEDRLRPALEATAVVLGLRRRES